ncbi:MAG: ATP-binding cassette domain-containing protein [Gammaproteobacteria bacterium]|nr:ATP-binding cassette domain-containing protein [Gammaproteobacteria bacterium]
MLELRALSKSYDGTVAVAPLDLACLPGETTVLIGPSGCGKSTLLRLITGLVAPDAGQVVVAGQVLGPDNVRALRHRMGYVIQEGGLFPHLTAGANVGLLVRHLGWPETRIAGRLAELARLVHVAPELLMRYPAELSGGQRQRVGLMRALMPDPELLLLDEPLGALDPMIRSRLQEDLRHIFRRLGKTVVLVTHDIAEAAFFASSIILMRAGHVVQRGTLEDLVRRPAEAFVTEFITAQRRPLEALMAATP